MDENKINKYLGVPRLTIVRLDTLQVLLPTQVLAVDLAHIGDEKGVFISCFTRVLINAGDALLQSVANHLFGDGQAILVGVPNWEVVRFGMAEYGIGRKRLQRQSSIILKGSRGGGRCHNHAAGRRAVWKI